MSTSGRTCTGWTRPCCSSHMQSRHFRTWHTSVQPSAQPRCGCKRQLVVASAVCVLHNAHSIPVWHNNNCCYRFDQAPVVLEKLKDRENTFKQLQVCIHSLCHRELPSPVQASAVHLLVFVLVFQERMASPEVSSNPTEFQKVARAAADLEQTVVAYRQYTQLQQELAEAKELAAEFAGAPRVLLSDVTRPQRMQLKNFAYSVL